MSEREPASPRRSRRVRREATDGVPEEQRSLLSSDHEEAPEQDTSEERGPRHKADEWWTQQRPPHWG